MQGKRNKKKKSLIIPIVIIIAIIICGIVIFLNKKDYKNITTNTNYDGNSLIGTFIYEENKTIYLFEENGTGSMSSDDYNYEYKYKVDGNTLSIDFDKDEVHDVTYTFELRNGVLKLISKEGTVSIGEEYILKKEDK